MLVFRQQHQRLLLAPHLRVLVAETASTSCPAHDTLVSWLIDCGEIEAGVTDALCAEYDAPHPFAQFFGAATRAAADAVVASARHADAPDRVNAAIARLTQALRTLLGRPWPAAIDTIARPISEGYAYYSLTPEMYIRGALTIAERFAPARACVIGIRSIGTSLAAIVASTLADRGIATDTCTVRPRGHPFSRYLRVSTAMEAQWRASAATDALFIVADEGPGLSGTSFAGTIRALLDAGVDDRRIVIMPSAAIDLARRMSRDTRELLSRVAIVSTDFEDVAIMPIALDGLRDISAGAWRADSFDDPAKYPAVFPQHERRKYRQVRLGANPDGAWMKWVGLGRYGRANYTRAQQLAEWGMAPPPVAVANGFMLMPHIPGQPMRSVNRPPGLIEALADYLAMIACESQGPAIDGTPGDLAEMLRMNVREGLGARWLPGAEAIAREQLDGKGIRLVHADARMQPHEWLRTPTGAFVKTDGFEHHDDHFFPGPTDIAWDVAGICVEWRLSAREEAALLERYRARSGDAHIAPRLEFFRAAYLAFRLGYAALAVSTLGDTPDGHRFATLRDRYAVMLRAALGAGSRAAVAASPSRIVASSGRRSPRTPRDRAADSYDADADRTNPV
jgi:hypothetical protein